MDQSVQTTIADVVFYLVWLGCILACCAIASKKGRSVGGWGLLGFFLGPIAVLVVALLSSKRAKQE